MPYHRTRLTAQLHLLLLSLTCSLLWSSQALTAAKDCKNDGSITNNEYPYHAQLDEYYNLTWNFNTSHIVFHIKVKAVGYVGFGISDHGDMYPGDMVIAWMDGQTVHFHDRHASGRAMPTVDKQQDWTLLDFKTENSVYSTMTVLRKLDTCDLEGDIPIEKGTSRVIYAYSDVTPPSDDVIPYHGTSARGTKSLILLDPPPVDSQVRKMPDDVKIIELVGRNYSVPSALTTYNCIIFKMDMLKEKHHLIRFEPVIQKGHEKLVHHVVVYRCGLPVDESVLGVPYQCYSSSSVRADCDYVSLAWAVGGTGFDFPSNVGQSMGAPGDPVYYKLEMHYDNPSKTSGLFDSSGLRLFVTKKLRQHDSGMLQIGTDVGNFHIIPPKFPDLLTRGYCRPACLDKALGERLDEIRIFGNFLHSHLLGRRMSSRHIRNGVELPPIARDDHYDFNYQETRLLPEERVVKKGDTLIMDCHYDSTKRTGVTFGGLGTTDEMCLGFIMYYPKTNLSICETRVKYQKAGQSLVPAVKLYTTDWSVQSNRDIFTQIVQESDVLDKCLFMDSSSRFTYQPLNFTEYVTERCQVGGSEGDSGSAGCSGGNGSGSNGGNGGKGGDGLGGVGRGPASALMNVTLLCLAVITSFVTWSSQSE